MTPSEIKTLRSALSWSQSRLAQELGVSVRTVKHWEAGTRNPSGPVLVLLKQLSTR